MQLLQRLLEKWKAHKRRKIDTPKSKKKSLEERVNEYEKGLFVIRTILGKKRLFCKKCNRDLGDDQIRKSQIDIRHKRLSK